MSLDHTKAIPQIGFHQAGLTEIKIPPEAPITLPISYHTELKWPEVAAITVEESTLFPETSCLRNLEH